MHIFTMELWEIITAGIIIFLGGMVQSIIGFGYALFATPLLLWLGIPLQDVIVLVSTSSMIQACTGVMKLRDEVPWRLSIKATVIRLLSLGLGLFFLKKLVGGSLTYVKIVIGGMLTLLVLVQLLYRPAPVKTTHPRWDLLAFIASGVIGGTCGMGGPPLVLWATAHDWSSEEVRGFLFAVFMTSIPVQLLLMGFTFGFSILLNVVWGIVCLPLIYLGTSLALPIGTRLGIEKLRLLTYIVLLVIGVSSMIAGFQVG